MQLKQEQCVFRYNQEQFLININAERVRKV